MLPLESSNTYRALCIGMCVYTVYMCMGVCACMHMFLLEGAGTGVFSKIVVKGHLRALLVETIELYNSENDFKNIFVKVF